MNIAVVYLFGPEGGSEFRLDVQTDFGAGFGGRGSTGPLKPADV
jgi:hypothetical protein